MFVGLHLLVTRQEGVLYLKDKGVLVQEIASVRVSQICLRRLVSMCVPTDGDEERLALFFLRWGRIDSVLYIYPSNHGTR